MSWLSIVLMVLKLLKQAKSANSQQEFVSAVQAENGSLAANGAILQWFWDHREEIIALVLTFFNKSTTFKAPPTPGTSSAITSADGEEAEVLALVEELKS